MALLRLASLRRYASATLREPCCFSDIGLHVEFVQRFRKTQSFQVIKESLWWRNHRCRQKIKEISYAWEGKDRSGKMVKDEMRAAGTAVVSSMLRRQGVNATKIKKIRSSGSITDKDITLFTRQFATMMKSGVPFLQPFDIVGKDRSNRAMGGLLMNIKNDVETDNSLANAFRKYPLYFDALYCNLVDAGEASGILDDLLGRLATYKEKI